MADQDKLNTLIELEGFEDDLALAAAGVLDENHPGICMNEGCNATYDYEPDQDRGWCEECQTNTVKSGLVLMGF